MKDLIDPRIDMISSSKLPGEELPLTSPSPLYYAIKDRNLEQVKILIKNNENPMASDINGDSCLHYAVKAGQFDILKYLIEEVECPPGTEGQYGTNILHIAAAKKQFSTVRYLVESEKCKLDPTSEDEDGHSALHYACQGGNLDIVRYFTEYMTSEFMKLDDILYEHSSPESDSVLNEGDVSKNPVCCASYFGHISIVNYFVEECKYNPLRASADTHITPMESAIAGNQLHVVKYLTSMNHCPLPAQRDRSLVHLAAEKASVKMIEYLTQTLHCDFNSNYESYTPLHVASLCGNLDAVYYFLDTLKCDPNARGYAGIQPIHYAAKHGHLKLIDHLVKKYSVSVTALADNGDTPLHVATRFDQMSVVKYLTLEHSCDPSFIHNNNEGSCLHVAAVRGHTDIARYFIKECNCDPNIKSKHDITPLIIAAEVGQLEFVKFINEEIGCDMTLLNDDQRNTLQIAILHGKISTARYLVNLKIYNLNSTDRLGMNIVHYTAHSGDLDTMKYLIEEVGMDMNLPLNNHGRTPVCEAAIMGHLPVVRYLLEHGCVQHDKKSYTPLHYATMYGFLDIIEYIMESDFSGMYSFNPNRLPLLGAVTNGHLSVVKYFIEEKQCDPFAVDEAGNTLLHAAALQGHLEVIDYLTHCELPSKHHSQGGILCFADLQDFYEYLNSQKIDPNASNHFGFKPIHLAAEGGHLKVVKYLVNELKCDPNSTADNSALPGYTSKPIHCAAKNGRLSVVRYLVEEENCDPSSKRDSNLTPLHDASYEGHLYVVRYLITEQKVDPFSRHLQTGATPMHFAAEKNRFEVVRFFVKELSHSPLVTTYNGSTPLHVALRRGSSISALLLITAMFKLVQTGTWKV